MENKVRDIYTFLLENRKYNKELQTKYYRSILSNKHSCKEKIIALLYHTVNTQSQPDMDKIAYFQKQIHQNIQSLESFSAFIKFLCPNKNERDYRTLFIGMKSQQGWGEKTSALFVKSIFHIHNGRYDKELKIWNDAPTNIDKSDELFLPVDKVIETIFKNLNSAKWNFKKINAYLKMMYKGEEMEVWDDLWFWGFVTQKGSDENRVFEWNENKYWSLSESDKRDEEIREIRSKAETFLQLLN